MFTRVGTLVPQCIPQQQQSRGMATLKAISIRLRSVKNIQKITASMKMVSAAKYARAEKELKIARPYGVGASSFYEKADVKALEADAPKKLIIASCSDRGLCGAIHSGICRAIKADLGDAENENVKIICIGDKSRQILSRIYAKNFLFCVNEIGRKTSVFEDASKIASALFNAGYEFDSAKIFFNRFRSVVSYRVTELPIFNAAAVNAAEKVSIYDSLDADVVQSYLEYSLASLIFYALKEGACSEQSSRMTAMDSATKNAGEMIEKLTLTFNRTRQAVITRELIEIISGAAAL